MDELENCRIDNGIEMLSKTIEEVRYTTKYIKRIAYDEEHKFSHLNRARELLTYVNLKLFKIKDLLEPLKPEVSNENN